MSVTKEESLSPDELRKRLYQTFKNRGVLDTLKTQLRNQLIQELKHPVLGGDAVPRPVHDSSDSVLVTAANSVVLDHLQTAGYEYTISVFYPECGMSKEKVFSTKYLLELMKINPHSQFYKSLASKIQKGQQGFLMTLLRELTDHQLHGEHCDADTQTSTSAAYRESLADKMQVIDEQYEALRHTRPKWASFEAKLAEYRKEIEEQVQAEMNTQLQHFKEVEIAKVKTEEREKSRREVLELRRGMERTYEAKSEALINREKNAIDRLQKQQEIEEKAIYMQRQDLLKEIESVRNRETELRQRADAFEKNCKLQEEKIKATEDLLRRREFAVKTMEDTYDQKLKNELTRYQLELKEDYLKRTETLTENEKQNKVQSTRIQKESAIIESKAAEHSKTLSELKRLQMELETVQSQATLLSQQNDLLREQLETMSDYTTLKREKVELQAQLRLLKKQLEEKQQENHRLHHDLRQPSQEQLASQAEVRRLETARRLDKEEFLSEKQVLHGQLQQEVERCSQLKALLLECEEKAQWMSAQAEEMKTQLRQTQQALENEVLRNPKPSLVDRSVLELVPDKLLPPDIYIEGAAGSAGRAGYRRVCDAAGPSGDRWQPWVHGATPDADSKMLAGAMARIRELEQEAETLEEAYRNYQQRAVQASVADFLPPRQPVARQTDRHAPLAQPRVTFAPDRPQLPVARPTRAQKQRHLLDTVDRASSPGDRTPPAVSSPPPRRLSSTPVSISKKLPRGEESQETSVVTFASLSPERQISPVPAGGTVSSDQLNNVGSPLSSPKLKSTARDQHSPPKLREVISSSSQESSPQPEKISIQDLTELRAETLHTPPLIQDEGHGVQETPTESRVSPSPTAHSTGVQDICGSPEEKNEEAVEVEETVREEEEDEELRWQLERRNREERRRQEAEEAQEHERRELELLEQEELPEEAQSEAQEREEREKGEQEKSTGEEVAEPQAGVSDTVKESQQPFEEKLPETLEDTDPLQKYMRMVLQGRQQQLSPKKEDQDQENGSQEGVASHQTDEKDDSIAAFSHEDADEDFW